MRLVLSALLAAGLLAGCAIAPRYTRETATERSVPPRIKQPIYQTDGEEGRASFYAHDFHGHKTANGEIYDMYDLTCAHPTLPFNTILLVTNLENRQKVKVRVNDRGPFVQDRIVDLSLGAAKKIGLEQTGTAIVRLQVVTK